MIYHTRKGRGIKRKYQNRFVALMGEISLKVFLRAVIMFVSGALYLSMLFLSRASK